MCSNDRTHWWIKLGLVLPIFLLAVCVANAQVTVKGKVTDDSNEALPGVSIKVKNATNGATTDINGNYSISVPESNASLLYSFIGFATQEIAVNGRTTINVSLSADSKSLQEVVVVGYGTQKRATIAGSISTVKGAELVKSPQPNLSNSLAGRFSGVIATNRTGEPGYDGSKVTIRGISTTGNTDVLVVVDGVPGQLGGMERLDPNDIESISVLKDASAAVYGSRAANGVILITTKKGVTGKPTINYSFNQGFSSPTQLPDMADAATYATIRNEIQYYTNQAGGMNQVYSAEQIEKFRNGSDPLNYPNTNWANEVLRKSAPQSQHSLSLRGGSEAVKYYLSLGTLSQDALYKNSATKYDQYNFRSNIDGTVSDNFKIGLSLAGRQENRQFPNSGAGDIFRSVYRAYPTISAYYPNGYPTSGIENNNPATMVTDMGGLNKNPRLTFNGILRASYSIPQLKGLSVDGFYALDRSQSTGKVFRTPYLVYDYNTTTGVYNTKTIGEQKASLTQSLDNYKLSTANLKLNFQRKLGLHNIDAFVAYEQSGWSREFMEAGSRNFPSAQTPELSQGGTDPNDRTIRGWSEQETRISYLGRLNYNFKEKYLAEVQFRADGSSIFPKSDRFGYFPGVLLGWRVSSEDWFKNSVPFINDLKIRATYGELGGDNVPRNQFVNNYAFNNQYTLGSTVVPGIDLVRLANPSITWEVSKKTDLGFNTTFLNNFSLEFIYFKEKRDHLLSERKGSIPAITGIVNQYEGSLVPHENIARVDNKGIESTLGYNHSGKFNYGISGNVTFAKSNRVFTDELVPLEYQRETGKPVSTYLLYRTMGIFKTQQEIDNYPHVTGAKPGDLIFEDYNKDGKIDNNDRTRTEYGNMPQITYGFTLNAAFKGFDFSSVFAGQGRVRQYVLGEAGTIGNFYSSWADNRWSPANPNGTYPRVDTRASSAISGGLYRNDFWLFNTAFFRLKNVELGYTLPKSLVSGINLQSVRIYTNAFNVFTITKVKDFDPELDNESGQFYPQQRIVNLGLNVKF
ncbi:SusC/RagA family TonB-linked outer membrane protein [Paradesertivirga mongoliensis]|uniref:SusC/RagA family TonB-linked outer membrane protein n=1 Tax=Paradesertivirga mongoliensis TaxID=2100740 RepID=A0ABW4ZLG7_9SPHI|nr:TonB-dependent receptor [Pedobacter mongoliensis]